MRYKHISTPIETNQGLPNTISCRVTTVYNEKTDQVIVSTDLVYKKHNIPLTRRNEKRDLEDPEWVEQAKNNFKART
jgi:hypothetical protein